ncbi:MAG TPA: response regulator transcription factor [Verrucomicrobiae bacterium]|nr:response regulator transcription factor [Verrucomicrobiae bacterium]
MKNPEKIRILIADDHYVVRIGLAALIGVEPDMEVVATAVDGAQALELFRRFQPDLALLDMRMPVKDGIQTAMDIRAQFPAARVIMLTAFDGDEDIHKALQAGAQGYVFKNSSVEKLIPALRAVVAGQRWIPKEVASRLASRKTFENLTSREVQVLQELAKGLANKEIADALNISEHTVKTHLKNILGKLRAADRTEAVTTAIQRGIIHLEPAGNRFKDA